MATPNEILNLVEQDRFELMMRCPFFGRIICSMEPVIVRDPQVRLACTDYRRIFISGDAYSALPEGKRLAVLAHEVLHVALRHVFRIGNRDKNRFEKAADIEVTFVLTESFSDPYGIKVKEEWRELTAEQIYDLLPSRENKTKAKSEHCSPNDAISGEPLTKDQLTSGEDDGKQDERNDGGNNTNGKSESQDSKSKNKPSKSKRSNAGDKSSNGDGDGRSSGDGEDGDGDGGSVDGGGSNDEDGVYGDGKQAHLSEFRPQFDGETEMNCIALSSGMLMDMKMSRSVFGKGLGSSDSAFERLLGKLDKPRMSWKVLLRQFLRLCRRGAYSWMRPNHRFVSRGLYLPGHQGNGFSGIVALDTSPSTVAALPRFVSELTGLLKAFGKFDITIIECADCILQVWSVSSNEPIPAIEKHKFKSGLGTDFTPVFDYIRNHHLTPNVLIYFTDGEGPCLRTEPPYPVIWMLTEDGEAPVPWGKAIYYEEV